MEMDRKLIPMSSGEIRKRQKDLNLGTTGAATIIAEEEAPGPSEVLQLPRGSSRWQRKGKRTETTSVTAAMKRLEVDWNVKDRMSGGRKG